MAPNQTNQQEDRTLKAEINLYYDLYLPEKQPAPLLIALHGYGANKQQMMREARQMAPKNFAIASPQGFYQHLKEPKEEGDPLRFGFGWLTNFRPEESVDLHHKVLLDLIDQLVSERAIDSRLIFLLGFSQSCALNYRFAFTYPDRLRGVIGICGGLPGDWETNTAYRPTNAALLHLAGITDGFYPPTRVADYANRLKVRAKNVEFHTYEGGHEIVPPMRLEVHQWLGKQGYPIDVKTKSDVWG